MPRKRPFELVALGWHLLPIAPGEKRPITRHGVLDASNNPKQIENWLREHPGCNWGVAAGPSGLVILDPDSAQEVRTIEGLDLPLTVTVKTPRGRHYYFRSKKAFQSSKGRVAPGIDVRAGNAYVVCPPSTIGSRRYLWLGCPEYREIAPLPKWLGKKLFTKTEVAEKQHLVGGLGDEIRGLDNSRSGRDARFVAKQVLSGLGEKQIYRLFERRSEKFQERLALRGRGAADHYFAWTLQWARDFCARNRTRGVIERCALEVLRQGDEELARLVVHASSPAGPVLFRVVVPVGEYVDSDEMYEAVCGDLDPEELLAEPKGWLKARSLKGRELDLVVRDGRVVWARAL